jgi:hypothetical protein
MAVQATRHMGLDLAGVLQAAAAAAALIVVLLH